MANKFKVVALKELKLNFFVRRGINTDHVLMLAELYEAAMTEHKDSVAASKAIQAIQVTEDMELVDGRHRKEAMELAGITEARVEMLPSMSTSELVVMAAKANYGGALPPTREDMIFTVEQLLTKHGMTQRAVEEGLSMLPKSVVRKYINMATKRINETKLKLALSDIAAGGVGLKQAAKAHGVKEEALQLAIEGKKPKAKVGSSQANSILSTYAKGFGNQVSRIVNKTLEEYKDGEIPKETAQAVVNHFGHLLRRMFLRVTDWDNRLKALEIGSDTMAERPTNPHNSAVSTVSWSSGIGRSSK